MNKQIVTIILILSIINASFAHIVTRPKQQVHNEEIEFCKGCIDFVDKSINQLVQEIIQGGIIGSCGALCSILPNSLFQMICNLGCDAVGIDEFIKLLDDVNVDPIWMCEEVFMCKENLNANASIAAIGISPLKGVVCDTFSIGINFNVNNTIGTGEVAFAVIDPMGNVATGEADLLIQSAPGNYQAAFTFQAAPGQGESYPTGSYQLQVAICEGSCGSDHKGTILLAEATQNFTIVNDQSSGSGSGSGAVAFGANSGSGSGSFSGSFSGQSSQSQSSQAGSGSAPQCSSNSGSGSGAVRFI